MYASLIKGAFLKSPRLSEENAVKVGQKIKRGDLLGYVGSTGKSTGAHVHYEIWTKGKAINPRDFLGEGRDVFQG